jgi:hypothetical protein
MYILRGQLELFRFEILTECTVLARDRCLDDARKKTLSSRARQEAKATAVQMRTLEVAYIRSRPAVNMDDLKAERAWFAQNCRERGDKYVEEYSKLAVHLLTQSGYVPVSLQERADIVKAFGFCKSLFDGIHRCNNRLPFQHTGDTSTIAKMGTPL